MIFADISKWIMLVLIVIVAIFIIKAGLKIINILITIFALIFIWFSFFTEVGSTRLTIMLKGHPIIAYTTSLEKQDDISTNEVVYFKSSKDVIVKGEKLKYIKSYTKWIVRLPGIDDING